MQFYTNRNVQSDENLGIPIMVAAGAVTKAAGAFNTIKSLFGGGSNKNMARGFSKRTGTGRLYSDAEKNAIASRAQAAGIDPLRMARIEAGMEKMPGSSVSNASGIDNIFSQLMATGKMYTTAEKNELQRRADAAGLPVKQIAWNDKRNASNTAPARQIIAARSGPNMARSFSLRGGTGRGYTDAEKNALILRGQRIGVSGEQMARIEAGLIPAPTKGPLKNDFDFTKLMDFIAKPAAAASAPPPVNQIAYQQPYYPQQNYSREQQNPAKNTGISPAMAIGGAALLLGTGFLLTRKK